MPTGTCPGLQAYRQKASSSSFFPLALYYVFVYVCMCIFIGEGMVLSNHCHKRKRKKNRSWLALVTHIMCLDVRELSALFTHENGNCAVTGKAQATENVLEAFKRKIPTFRKAMRTLFRPGTSDSRVNLSPKFLTCCVKGTQTAMRPKKKFRLLK